VLILKAEYLITLVEQFCKENNLDISNIYSKIARLYQDTYGINIVIQMQETGEWDITKYLEDLGIIDRYVTILNKIKRGEYNV
jgi:hypothetical protein